MRKGSKQAEGGIWLVGKLWDMRIGERMSEGEDVQAEGVIKEIAVMAGGNAVDLEVF